MHYSVQPSEIAGFVALLNAANFYAQKHGEKSKWLEQLPDLKQTDFEKLVDFVRDEHLSEETKKLLSEMSSVDDLKEFITKSPNPKIKADKINAMIDSVYPVYQKFYQDNEKILQNKASQVNDFLNKMALDPLKQVEHFFNPDYKPKEDRITVYMFPTSIIGVRGENFHTQQEDQQWIAIGIDTLDGTRPIDIGRISSTIYHEKVHGLFHDSGADKKLSEYLKGDNNIVQTLKDFPQLKRNPNVSDIEEAEMMVDESITSAFQEIMDEDVRGEKKEVLYANHVINKMAHKTLPLLREALKNGETFGPEFMKKFEKEFEMAFPEKEKEVAPKQEKTQQLQNPLWLLYKNKQQ
jgi:uncharacterized membrane-anchored protein YjiN (DUF445 family)